jgi:hypothetical protein
MGKVEVGLKEELRAVMVDIETGELLEGMPILDRQKPKFYWGETFVITFQDAMRIVARSKLNAESSRVLFYVLATVTATNEWSIISQREASEELEMHRPSISRALRDLVQREILTKGCRIGKGFAYSLNPHLGWIGPFKNRDQAKQSAPKLHLVHSREAVPEEKAA